MPANSSKSLPIPVNRTPTFVRQLKGLAKKYRRLEKSVDEALAGLSATGRVGLPLPSVEGHSLFKVKIAVDRLGKRRGVRMICAAGRGRGSALFIYARKNQKSVPREDLVTAIRGLPEDDATSDAAQQ